jgi:hypothetical protein
LQARASKAAGEKKKEGIKVALIFGHVALQLGGGASTTRQGTGPGQRD